MNCFCGMFDRRICSLDHCQRSSPSRISNTPSAGFELMENLSSCFIEWSYATVITTTPNKFKHFINKILLKQNLGCYWSFWYVFENSWIRWSNLNQYKYNKIQSKEYKCLHKVIHEVDIKWTAALFNKFNSQNMSWFLSQHRKTLLHRSFILKSTERPWFLK